MALSVPPPDPTLDPLTGLPVGADYFTQYQIPLNSQPVNLTELNAQGRQNNWLYPDHIPPTLARLQARDLTNDGNAQDLSTDGQRNLNVNIARSSLPAPSGGGNPPVHIHSVPLSESTTGFGSDDLGPIGTIGDVIYGLSFSWTFDAGNVRDPGRNGYVQLYIPGQSTDNDRLILASLAISVPSSGTTDRIAGEVHRWFDRGMIFPFAFDFGDGKYHLWIDVINTNGGNMSLGMYMSV